jgi:hypothetical protein
LDLLVRGNLLLRETPLALAGDLLEVQVDDSRDERRLGTCNLGRVQLEQNVSSFNVRAHIDQDAAQEAGRKRRDARELVLVVGDLAQG